MKESLEEKIAKSSTEEIIRIVRQLATQKHAAYTERNQLVAFMSRLYPAHLSQHPESDKEWQDEWRWIVCIHSPAGQLTWHIHISEKKWFNHLKEKPDHWDKHTTPQKYARLRRLPK